MTILILHNANILFCIISSLFCISLIGTLDTISNVRRLRDALLHIEPSRCRYFLWSEIEFLFHFQTKTKPDVEIRVIFLWIWWIWAILRLWITLYQCKIDQKHHLQALEIVSTIENRIQNQVRHPNRLHSEGNSRFRKPRVTVGQQSFNQH